MNKKWMKDLISNLMESVIPTSVAGKVMRIIICESVWTGRVNTIVNELESNEMLKA